MRVLVVDDDEFALDLLSNTLTEAGHCVQTASDGRDALELVRTGQFRFVISDWEMPHLNGLDLCREIRKRRFGAYVYVILVTGRKATHDVVEGLDAGADDFIAKPFDPMELCVRVRAGERILSLHGRDLTIFTLAKLAESRDPDTGAHLERVREYCRVIADHLSRQDAYRDEVDAEFIETLYRTSPLHDIGKVGLPDCVLLKPGHLTDVEFNLVKTHTSIGAETLDIAAREHPEASFLHMARDIALTHHERFDGSGYPAGLKGTEIPLCGRIVALADVYDALTSHRIYKSAFPHDVARSIIIQGSNSHFDPDIVDAFVQNEEAFVAIRRRFAEESQATREKPPAVLEAAASTYN